MKVIFLDFDGVLNSHEFMRARQEDILDCRRESDALDPEAIARLNRLVAETGAVVVVSSSWRITRSVERLQQTLDERGFVGTVIDKTIDWYMCATRYEKQQRGDEIRMWLDEHPEVESFIVLDDSSDMDAVVERHIQTSLFTGGLQDDHVARAVAMLGPA